MTKKHIVVLVGSYYPNFSAVGICARNIVNELKIKADISLISQKTDINEKDKEEYDGYQIIRTKTKLSTLRLYATNKKKTSHKVLSLFWTFLINLTRIIYYLKAILCKVNIKNDQVKQYVKILAAVNKEKPIDAILCCSFPFESVLAGLQYKHLYDKEVKVIPYLFDNFAEREGLHRTSWNKKMKWNKHLNLIKGVLQESDSILAMHTLRDHFQKYYSKNTEKIIYLEHPLLIETKEDIRQISKRPHLVYTGAFLKNYVEPYFLVDVFKEILRTVPIDIDFYVMGNCTEYIDHLISQFPQNVRNHGKVTFETAHKAILNSDILLCVAEHSGVQMSSKIFTYMSEGKPIILFYKSDSDINKRILSKYPLVLFIKEETRITEEITKYITHFIDTNKNNKLSFQEVRLLYPDAEPQFTSQKILAILNNT